MSSLDFFCDSFPFIRFIKINFIVFVDTLNSAVCRNYNNIEVVDLAEFDCFCSGCTSHTRKFCIHTEEVLECNCSHCAVTLCNLQMFFCFDCLVQTVTITAAFKYTTCKFIYDLYCTVTDNVIYVNFIKFMCTNCLSKVVYVFKVFFIEN